MGIDALSDPMERRQILRVPSAGKPADQGRGRGTLQHTMVWRGRRRRLLWWCWCRGEDLAAVAPTTMAVVGRQLHAAEQESHR
jgi:hypothetical protein